MPTYLRFVVADLHRNSGKELGVFHAVLRLRERGRLYAHEEELHDFLQPYMVPQVFAENFGRQIVLGD
jgi:hypothetical protein